MPISLRDQVVLVVGGSSGIGRAAAVLFARHGAAVVVSARRRSSLEQLQREMATEGFRVAALAADVCRLAEVQQLTSSALAQFGKIDIVLYAAGTNTPERSMEQLAPATWNSILDTNLNGAFYVASAVLPAMRAARSGHLIFISSIAGVAPDLSGAAYQASKRGMIGLAHAIRLEERQHGIRTSVLCPGLTNTDLLKKRPGLLSPEVLANALQPQDVAETILHVATLPTHVAIPELHILPAAL